MRDFYKFHGLGNDFVILADGEELKGEEAKAICDRHRGVGADGVLLVQRIESTSDSPVKMVIVNRDGTRPQMCGNGVRCVAGYAQKYWGLGPDLVVESDAGPRRCEIKRVDARTWSVAVEMGRAKVETSRKAVELGGRRFSYVFADMGNPHAVIFEMPEEVEVIDRAGEAANADHEAFPEGVNLEFVEATPGGFRVVVYERGVGRTQACGTGACAVAAAAWETGRWSPGRGVDVILPGGALRIEGRGEQMWMTGPAREVFRGVWRP